MGEPTQTPPRNGLSNHAGILTEVSILLPMSKITALNFMCGEKRKEERS